MIEALPASVGNRVAATARIPGLFAACKELVANALDSTPSSGIAIEFDLALASLSVSDDGSGIARADLELVGAANATSKAGRRGMALHSIATLSDRVLLTSCERGDSTPLTLRKEWSGGCAAAVRPALSRRSCHGTTVAVRGLMRNVPVRARLLASAAQRAVVRRSLKALVQGFALRHHTIAWTLVERGARTLLRSRACGSPGEVAAQLQLTAAGDKVGDVSAAMAALSFALAFAHEHMALRGYASVLGAETHAPPQVLLIDGIPCPERGTERLRTVFLEHCCATALVPTAAAAASRVAFVLNLHTQGALRVTFAACGDRVSIEGDESEWRVAERCLAGAARRIARPYAPQQQPPPQPLPPPQPRAQQRARAAARAPTVALHRPQKAPRRELPAARPAQQPRSVPHRRTALTAVMLNTSTVPLVAAWREQRAAVDIARVSSSSSSSSTMPTRVVAAASHVATASRASSRVTRAMLLDARVVNQIEKSFVLVVASTPSALRGGTVAAASSQQPQRRQQLLALDPHAAHERIRLEKFEDALCAALFARDEALVGGGGDLAHHAVCPSAALAEATAVTLRAGEPPPSGALKRVLQCWGWRYATSASGDTVWVSAVPCLLGERIPASSLVEFVRVETQRRRTRGARELPAAVRKIIALKACHGAIRFGDELTVRECAALLRSLARCRLPFQCAHGRPSIVPLLTLDAPRRSTKALCVAAAV